MVLQNGGLCSRVAVSSGLTVLTNCAEIHEHSDDRASEVSQTLKAFV